MSNSETVSENRPGRPKLSLSPALKGLFPDLTTQRGLQNKHYIGCALRALGLKQAIARYPWFAGKYKPNFRAGILVEIGRIAEIFGDAQANSCADELLEIYPDGRDPDDGDKVSTREVAEVLRLWRLSQLRSAAS